VILDTRDGTLVGRGCALRVRDDGGRAVLTYKGPVVPGVLKVREELETEAASTARLLDILAALGFAPVFRYEKRREEFTIPGAIVAIDETPIGTFVEIEGEAGAIHAAAARLGFTDADYVTASYRQLYVASLPSGAVPADMVFPAPDAAR
jgi:adenylate cyclase class 2